MLSGNAEPCNTGLSTDKRLIVFKIPFIEISERYPRDILDAN